jgi:hypothetical protein
VQDLESKITTMQQSFKGEREREGDIWWDASYTLIQFTYIYSSTIFLMFLFVDILGSGATFTRWGKKSCPSNTSLVYTGMLNILQFCFSNPSFIYQYTFNRFCFKNRNDFNCL